MARRKRKRKPQEAPVLTDNNLPTTATGNLPLSLDKPPSSSSGRGNRGRRGSGNYRKSVGNRRLQEPLILIDIDLPTTATATEAIGGQALKCRSHRVGRGNRKDLIQEAVVNVETFQHAPPYILDVIPRRTRSRRKFSCQNAVLSSKKKLDSRAFECYLQKLWGSFSEERKIHFTYLDCLWFSLYKKANNKPKVLKWIKNTQIFSKKYVFVPIVCWKHWSLLIFCNFGESLDSETNKPCMLLLDSLQKADPRRLEPDIRKFVFDIFNEEGRSENLNFISRIPLMVPQVPQQSNGEECGKFVLYFIHLFMEGAPENFSIEEYPYFMKDNWFTAEGLDRFFKKLDHFEE